MKLEFPQPKTDNSNSSNTDSEESYINTDLYKMVVFPAPSKPRIKIRRSFVPHNLENRLENNPPTQVCNETYNLTSISVRH